MRLCNFKAIVYYTVVSFTNLSLFETSFIVERYYFTLQSMCLCIQNVIIRKIRIYAKFWLLLESSKLSFVQATRDRWQSLCGRWIKFLSVTIILSCVCCDGIIILSLTRPLTIVCTGRPFIIVEDYVAGSATNALQWMHLTNLSVFIFTTKITGKK